MLDDKPGVFRSYWHITYLFGGAIVVYGLIGYGIWRLVHG
jgi:hypothetical protein